MTRKDFELIAAAIKAAHICHVGSRDNITTQLANDAIDSLAHDFAERLKTTNAQFNRDRFLRACGVAS